MIRLEKNKILEIYYNVNRLFIDKMNISIKLLNDEIERNLFEDCIVTYKNSYEMAHKGSILDSLVIIRNSYELLMMLFGMRIDSNVRKEYQYADSYERFLERNTNNIKSKNYLSQKYLRQLIKKKYPQTICKYDEVYDVLSHYTHPTMYRNAIRYYEKNEIDTRVCFLPCVLSFPLIAFELLNANKLMDDITLKDMGIIKYTLENISILYMVKTNDIENIKKGNKYFYMDINKKYFDEMGKEQKKEILTIEVSKEDYDSIVNREMIKVLEKPEYYNISKLLLEMTN